MYSDELVKWLFKILAYSNTKCPVYNVGSDDKVSIQQLAKILAKRYNLNFNAQKLTSTYDDTYIPNINKAKNKFYLKNKYGSVSSVIKTIQLNLNKIYNDKK